MKNKQAFTLIELLVVVLIIGILAAVAVPQYEKAVEKARAVNMISLLKPIYQAAQVYYLNNGTVPSSIDELDVALSAKQKQKYLCDNVYACANEDFGLQLYEASNNVKGVLAVKTAGKYRGAGFIMFYDVGSRSDVKAGTLYCQERLLGSGDNSFQLSDGAYCKKLFHGGSPATPINARIYPLP